jgi:hypothetical protein
MQPPAENDRERARAYVRELAVKLSGRTHKGRRVVSKLREQEESGDSDPWTLRRINRLEIENARLQVRVERLEQPAESITPRYPHYVQPSRDEMRESLRRTGWYKTPAML